MTTATTTPPVEATPLPPPSGGGTRGAIAAEWTKLWSVRSTWWCLLAAAGLMVLLAASMGASFANGALPASDLGERMQLGEAALAGIQAAQFAIIAWAMLVVTAEYSTGSIRTSLQWVPRRSRLVLAKLAVVVAATFAAGVALGGLGAVSAWVPLGGLAAGDAAAIASDVLVVGLYVVLVSVLTLGVGLLLRSAVGTLVAVFVLLFVLPNLLGAVPIAWLAQAADYLPGGAAMRLLSGFSEPYGPTVAAVLLAAWAGAALLGGLTALRRRDA